MAILLNCSNRFFGTKFQIVYWKRKKKATFRTKTRERLFKQVSIGHIYETLRMHLRTRKIYVNKYIKAGKSSIFFTGSMQTVNGHIKNTNTINYLLKDVQSTTFSRQQLFKRLFLFHSYASIHYFLCSTVWKDTNYWRKKGVAAFFVYSFYKNLSAWRFIDLLSFFDLIEAGRLIHHISTQLCQE